VALYLPLGLLVSRALRGGRNNSNDGRKDKTPSRIVLQATSFCLAYGITDELHQIWTPGRSVELLDLMANTIGGAAGATLHVLAMDKGHQRIGAVGRSSNN
jgi:VanZ family protein